MAINRTDEYMPATDDFTIDAVVEGRPEQATSSAVQSGWDAADKLSTSSGDFPTEFKFTDGEFTVIKFIDQNGPFAIYKQHFLQQKTVGKRSYVSLGANDPLCTKLGSKPEDKRAFTIAVITPSGVQRQMLIASPRLYKTLHSAEFSPQGPLTKNYWAISRTGKMQQTVYNLNSIKPRDLLEDWGIDEKMAEDGVAAIKPFERSVIKEHTWEELEEIANSLL
jgi:ethanolamine utilization microcompartment shell protein EutS